MSIKDFLTLCGQVPQVQEYAYDEKEEMEMEGYGDEDEA